MENIHAPVVVQLLIAVTSLLGLAFAVGYPILFVADLIRRRAEEAARREAERRRFLMYLPPSRARVVPMRPKRSLAIWWMKA